MRAFLVAVVTGSMMLVSSNAIAQQAISKQQADAIGLSADQQLKVERAALNKKQFDASKDFQGLKLGLGFTFSHNLGTRRVETAEVVDKIVRVTEERNDAVRAIGEIHRFSTHDLGTCTEDDASGCARWGHGPFFSLQTGANDVIEAAGLGYMFGFRQAADRAQSLNLGVGLALDPKVKVLGDGIKENRALPGAETAVRFKTKSGLNFIVVVSFGF